MDDLEQSFGGVTYRKAEVIDTLTDHFKATDLEEMFTAAYHEQHGPDSRGRPEEEISGYVQVHLKVFGETDELPSFVMSTFHYLMHTEENIAAVS